MEGTLRWVAGSLGLTETVKTFDEAVRESTMGEGEQRVYLVGQRLFDLLLASRREMDDKEISHQCEMQKTSAELDAALSRVKAARQETAALKIKIAGMERAARDKDSEAERLGDQVARLTNAIGQLEEEKSAAETDVRRNTDFSFPTASPGTATHSQQSNSNRSPSRFRRPCTPDEQEGSPVMDSFDTGPSAKSGEEEKLVEEACQKVQGWMECLLMSTVASNPDSARRNALTVRKLANGYMRKRAGMMQGGETLLTKAAQLLVEVLIDCCEVRADYAAQLLQGQSSKPAELAKPASPKWRWWCPCWPKAPHVQAPQEENEKQPLQSSDSHPSPNSELEGV